MQPTPEDTLTGAERLLRAVLSESDLPSDAAATIGDVVRMVGQARKAVAERPAFLEQDNDRLRELLSDLIRELPATGSGTREEIRSYLEQRTAASPG